MKRFFKIAFLLLGCAAIVVFVCPRSLESKLSKAETVLITVGGGFSEKERKEVTVQKGTDAFEALKEIVKPYSYHPTAATIFRNTTVLGSLYDDVTMYVFDCNGRQIFYLHTFGRQKVMIGGTSYHMGYGGDETAQRFTNAISNFAEQYAAHEENNS